MNAADNGAECLDSNECRHPLLTAREIAEQHGVSLRTARRMLKCGHIPRDVISFDGRFLPARKIGSDGKSYPSFRSLYRRQKYRDCPRRALGQSLSYLRKADSIACKDGFTDSAIARLEEVFGVASEMLTRWRSVSWGSSPPDNRTHESEAAP